MYTVIVLISIVLMVVADQLSKYLVVANLAVGESVSVIDSVLNFTYVQNPGAVFGSLAGKGYIFNTVTVAVVIIGIALIVLKRIKPRWLVWSAAMIIGGGIGNLIDRLRLKYVVDFIDVICFGDLWCWVFNIADIFVVLGCLSAIAYCIFDMVNEYRAKRASIFSPDDERNCVTPESEDKSDADA